MALVFVHGVNVRYNPENDPYVNARDAFFRQSVLASTVSDPSQSLIVNPYWGGAAAKFPWEHGGLPQGRYEQFGADDNAAAGLISDLALAGLLQPEKRESMAGVDPDQVLVLLARISLAAAVDRIWVVAAQRLDKAVGRQHVDFSLAIAAYVAANPHPDWLDSVKNDKEFVSALFRNAAGRAAAPEDTETFGVADDVQEAIRGAATSIREGFVEIFTAAKKAASDGARHWLDDVVLKVRTPVHKSVATFLGDAFVYFRQREAGAPRYQIADIVSKALNTADADRSKTKEPLYLVAHSMGGNIVYDLLTSTKRDFEVDVLVTVGSQVAVFEELKLFESSDRNIPNATTKKVALPKNIKRWINVFDSTDILGFAAGRVFENVEDYHFATGHIWAHGGYFVEPMFHERLGRRLRGDA